MSKFAMHPMFGNGVIDLAGSGGTFGWNKYCTFVLFEPLF
jgi:hypothetical protein